MLHLLFSKAMPNLLKSQTKATANALELAKTWSNILNAKMNWYSWPMVFESCRRSSQMLSAIPILGAFRMALILVPAATAAKAAAAAGPVLNILNILGLFNWGEFCLLQSSNAQNARCILDELQAVRRIQQDHREHDKGHFCEELIHHP